MMIDAGAVFKLEGANIDVGSTGVTVDRSLGALQVLGTPGQSVYFTSYKDERIGVDTYAPPTTPAAGGLGRTGLRQRLRRANQRSHLRQPGRGGHLPRQRQLCRHPLRRRVGHGQRGPERVRPGHHDRRPAHRLLHHDHPQRRRGHVGRSGQPLGIGVLRPVRREPVHQRLRPRGPGPARQHPVEQQPQRPVPPRGHQCRAVDGGDRRAGPLRRRGHGPGDPGKPDDCRRGPARRSPSPALAR